MPSLGVLPVSLAMLSSAPLTGTVYQSVSPVQHLAGADVIISDNVIGILQMFSILLRDEKMLTLSLSDTLLPNLKQSCVLTDKIHVKVAGSVAMFDTHFFKISLKY